MAGAEGNLDAVPKLAQNGTFFGAASIRRAFLVALGKFWMFGLNEHREGFL
jgi:hypothetical protein